MHASARRDVSVLVPTLAAGLVRLAHLLALRAHDPLFDKPVVDELFHANQAQEILAHGPLLSGGGAFYKAPLLSYVDAFLFLFFGRDGGTIALHVVNAALGTLAVFLAARIAWRIGGARAAWGAGLVLAFYGTAVFYDGTLLQPPLLAVFMLAAAEQLLAARDAADPFRPLLMAGLFIGLVTVTRGEGVLALAASAGWAAFVARRGAWSGMHPLRAAALVVVPAVLVVAPVTFRNTILERDPVVVSWNGGINFFMGNDPAFEQDSGNWHPDRSWMRLYFAPRLLGLTRGADHQRFFTRQALAAMASRPLTTLSLWAEKAALLVSGYEISNNRRIYGERDYSPVLAALLWRAGPLCFPAALVFPLLAAGLVLGGTAGATRTAPLWLLAAVTLVVPVLFFNTARYRLPAIVLLIPAAACGWCAFRDASRARRVVALGAFLVMLVLAIATVPAHPMLPPSDATNLADVAKREGRPDDELRWREAAVRQDPKDPLARIRLGDTLRSRKRGAEAIEQYDVVLNLPGLATDWRTAAMRSIARSYVDLGRDDEAVRWYRRLLDADPDHPVTNGRPDFAMRGVPPLEACADRLELSTTLARMQRSPDAAIELTRVGSDCAASDELAHKANEQLRALSGSTETVR